MPDLAISRFRKSTKGGNKTCKFRMYSVMKFKKYESSKAGDSWVWRDEEEIIHWTLTGILPQIAPDLL